MKSLHANNAVCAGILTAAAMLLSGCATEPSATEKDFGNSVRQMVRAQTYDPSTLDNPSRQPVTGLDGEHADIVLDAYRTDIAKPEQVRNEIQINVSE